jgi:DivIVA domain-containing protein
MLTLLLYVLIVGLVAALLFLVASAVFGRGEELGPLPEGTTVTVLPAAGIRGSDVRALRFQQVFRGYKAGEVDWALSRLAARIDELELQLERSRVATPTAAGESETAPAQPNTGSTLPTDTPPATANGTTTNFSTGTFFGGAPFAAPGGTTPNGLSGPTSAGPGTPTVGGAPFSGPGGATPNGLGGPAAGPGAPTVGGATFGGAGGAAPNGPSGPASADPSSPAFGAPAGSAGTTGYIAAPGPEQNSGFAPATEASATGWAPPPLPGDPPSSAGGLR